MALKFKCLTLVLSIFLFKLLMNVSGQGTVIGDKYYSVFTLEKVNWYRAYQLCAKIGMQLASIESQSELTDLYKYLFSNSGLYNNYWLSGNNLGDRTEYVWTSIGKKFSYTKWSPSQPGTLANRCVRTDAKFEWVTDACTATNYFICSRPVVPSCGITGRCSDNFYYTY